MERIKNSKDDFTVETYNKKCEYSSNKKLYYYNKVVWEVSAAGERPVSSVRPNKKLFEFFVGFDSEYQPEKIWETSDARRFYTSTGSRHVNGEGVFYE